MTFNITVDKVFNNDTVNALLDNGLDISADDESKWQVESSEMMAIRYLYQKSHPNMDKKAAYIFLVDKAEAPYEEVEGDMPRDQSAGFIFRFLNPCRSNTLNSGILLTRFNLSLDT